MQSFVYNALPSRVIFGSGTISRLKSEIERAGCQRALLLSTPEQADSLNKIAAIAGAPRRRNVHPGCDAYAKSA